MRTHSYNSLFPINGANTSANIRVLLVHARLLSFLHVYAKYSFFNLCWSTLNLSYFWHTLNGVSRIVIVSSNCRKFSEARYVEFRPELMKIRSSVDINEFNLITGDIRVLTTHLLSTYSVCIACI